MSFVRVALVSIVLVVLAGCMGLAHGLKSDGDQYVIDTYTRLWQERGLGDPRSVLPESAMCRPSGVGRTLCTLLEPDRTWHHIPVADCTYEFAGDRMVAFGFSVDKPYGYDLLAEMRSKFGKGEQRNPYIETVFWNGRRVVGYYDLNSATGSATVIFSDAEDSAKRTKRVLTGD